MLDNNERLTMVTMKILLTAVRSIFILTIVRPFIIVQPNSLKRLEKVRGALPGIDPWTPQVERLAPDSTRLTCLHWIYHTVWL